MLEAQTETIDGTAFTISPLPAMKAFLMLQRLGKVLGPALARVAGAVKGDAVDGAGAADALVLLFSGLPPEELETIVRDLLAGSLVLGEGGKAAPLMTGGANGKGVFDVVFQGRMGTLFKLLAFAIRVNYRDFFDALSGKLGAVAAKMQRQFAGSSTSPAGPTPSPSGA